MGKGRPRGYKGDGGGSRSRAAGDKEGEPGVSSEGAAGGGLGGRQPRSDASNRRRGKGGGAGSAGENGVASGVGSTDPGAPQQAGPRPEGRPGKGGKGGKRGRAQGQGEQNDGCDELKLKLWTWARERLQGEPGGDELRFQVDETRRGGEGKGNRGGGRRFFQFTITACLPAEAGGPMESAQEGVFRGQTFSRKSDALASAAGAVLTAFGEEVPPWAVPGSRTGGQREGRAQGGEGQQQRVLDPLKAREVLIGWLVRTHGMSRKVAESQDGIVESIAQQRNRGGGGPNYICTVVVPALQMDPFGGMVPLPKRKDAINAAYVAAVETLGIPIPPRAALTQRALQKQEMARAAREEKAEMLRNRQIEMQQRRMEQKMAQRMELERRSRERARSIFDEKLSGLLAEVLPPGAPPWRLPDPMQVVRGGSDRAQQRAVSDLANICNREPTLLEGPPVFFERSETLPGMGNVHFVVAAVRLRGADSKVWPPVVGCAYGAKRGSAKSFAAHQCLARIAPKATLPVTAEMLDESARLQQAIEGWQPTCDAWTSICNAVAEMRKLEAKGAGGARVSVMQTAEIAREDDPLSGPFRCVLVGRVPQESGLRDFRGVSAIGRLSPRLAIAAACQDAIARLAAVFGGGDMASWLRKMMVTPMELDDMPWDVVRNLRAVAYNSKEREVQVRKQLDAWWKHRVAGRRQTAKAPDLSVGAAQCTAEIYKPPEADGREDPKEIAKRKRGVPLLPVRSLRKPMAKILGEESVVVVSGGTGSGKSTQLPQYILDDFVGLQDGTPGRRPCIVVTQPRRIAAISVAERVAWERGEELGQTVGYSVRNDARPPRSRNGFIEFVTVGILLRRLMDPRDPDLNRYTHVLVDEVHERDLMTDFLLILLKELLVRRGDIRVILMSATLDVSTFTTYFWECSVLEVPSGPRYPVEEVYLEDLLYDPNMELVQQQIRAQASALAAQRAAEAAAAGSAMNPSAAEFVPGGSTWHVGAADSAKSTAPNPKGTGEDAGKDAGEEADELGGEAAGEEAGDVGGEDEEEEEEDDQDEEDEDGDGECEGDGEDDAAEDEDDDDAEDAEEDDDEEAQQQEHLQAPRRQEYVSWDIHELARVIQQKEENSRRAHEAEQAEVRAEQQQQAQNEGLEEGEEGGDDADGEGFRGSSTGLWWGSFEDGDALLDLCARLLLHLACRAEVEQSGLFDEKGQPGSILTFLPGWAEIKSVMERLQQAPQASSLWVLPLHSTLAKEDQVKIFQRAPQGKTKIILSTNIAESSVTIDDVLVVVDCGLSRELSYDAVRRLSTLETVWVSQSSSIQRKGRAGRVRNGRCYRLFTRTQFESTPWRTAPEMQRCELSATCLQVLAMQREVRDFLSRAPDPPAPSAVDAALRELVQLGAISPAPRSVPKSELGTAHLKERMLPLGETLSRMPLSPCLGRMLIMGVLFQCVDTACLLAAVLSAARKPFVCPPGKRKESLAYQRGFDPSSDLLACYAAAEAFEQRLKSGGDGMDSADHFAASRFLVPQRLRALLRSRDSLRDELVRAQLIDRKAVHRQYYDPFSGNGGWGGDAQVSNKKEEGDGDDAKEAEGHDDDDVGGWGAWEDEEPHTGNDYWGPQASWWWDEWRQWQDPSWLELHAHDDQPEMRKALLVAASPVNVAMRRRPFLAKHRTPTGLEAIVAPQSINAQPRQGKGGSKGEVDRRGGPSWWAYGSMQISNKQGFLRTTTLVDPYHIFLFGGLGVEYYRESEPSGGHTADDSSAALATEGLEDLAPVSMIDDWIEPQGSEETVWLLSALRAEVRRCIHMKVMDPSNSLPENSQWLLDEIATNVIGTATRRQARILSILPPQQILPPGGSVPTANPSNGMFGGREKGKGKGGDREKGKGKGKGKARGKDRPNAPAAPNTGIRRSAADIAMQVQ